MDDEQVITFLKMNGPSLPTAIAKFVRTNSVFIGAHLSTMLEKKSICISSIKIGSSPLYYLKEQRSMLEEYANHLDEKERKAFELLKYRKVLRDSEQNPFIRMSLRHLKDFAVQLNVRTNSSQEIFWKLHSVADEEASSIIKDILEPPAAKPKVEPQKPKIEKAKIEIRKEEAIPNEEPKIIKETMPKEEEKPAEESSEQKIEQKKPGIHKEKPKQKKQIQETLVQEQIKEPIIEPVIEMPLEKPEEKPLITGRFYTSVIESFGRKSITVVKEEMIKADNEYDFVITLPTPVGDLTYYCKAKNKKKINEGDLSSAVLKAQSKRLPVLFLAEGQLTRQAQKSLEGELKDQIKVMSL
jgi:hypothetical protein